VLLHKRDGNIMPDIVTWESDQSEKVWSGSTTKKGRHYMVIDSGETGPDCYPVTVFSEGLSVRCTNVSRALDAAEIREKILAGEYQTPYAAKILEMWTPIK
jgi:NADPH-dependent glutamate synthase beta subunit-like oxidoreductase